MFSYAWGHQALAILEFLMTNNDWDRILDQTHKAVRAFARIEVESLARKVIYSLQRQEASGIFGDSYAYKTIWDELCHDVQYGPFDLFPDSSGAMDILVRDHIQVVVERIPRHVAVLLTIYAHYWLSERDSSIIGSVWTDGICDVIREEVHERAGSRNLERFQPY